MTLFRTMNLRIQSASIKPNAELRISGSKSETNRLLVLRAMYPQLVIQNESDSDDSVVIANALNSADNIIDVGHAGTAMRFLTAYFANLPGREVTLTGSARMQQRPISILVDALRELGASIAYVSKDGFPPILIRGRNLPGRNITIDANVSSQYISALALIGARLPAGIVIDIKGEITSAPYINMTFAMLDEIGIKSNFESNKITIKPQAVVGKVKFTIESDWSSASYFYSIIALSDIGTQITLSSYKKNSFQGDSQLVRIYKDFGVRTDFSQDKIILTKHERPVTTVAYSLNDTPDIAQTIAVTCFGLGVECHLSGLQTLAIKETDRLLALKTELCKLGANVRITADTIAIDAARNINLNVTIDTYEDHRMAMAFATLAVKVPLTINNSEVVSKSYAAYWDHLKQVGFNITNQV